MSYICMLYIYSNDQENWKEQYEQLKKKHELQRYKDAYYELYFCVPTY